MKESRMRIGILSDMHVDMNFKDGNRVEDAVIKNIKDNKLDILITAGDVSGDYKKTLYTLEDIQHKSKAKVLFVPGNHDIWNKENPQKNTYEIYNELKKFNGNLSGGNIIIDDWAFVGDIGWYDYSFGSNEYKYEDFTIGKAYGRTWQDKKYVDWEMSDIEAADKFYNDLRERMDQVKDKKIILVTHMVIHEAFIVPDDIEMWKYFNAFLGSRKPLDLARKYNIKYAIMGHVHYRKRKVENGVDYICNCLNYRSQWHQKEDAFKEVDNAMCIIEV